MSHKIAIIGIAGRFPEAANLSEFRANLKNERDSVRPLSAKRIRETTIDPAANYQEIAYLEDIDKFDHRFFKISKGEARLMDPHHRLLLEVVHETFENAGYDPQALRGSKTAVMVGDVALQYAQHAESEDDPNMITGCLVNAALSGHVARTFDLRGPAVMVDTTCSSSLVAVHMAINELLLGNAEQALACGARLLLFPWQKEDYMELGIKSRDGRARAFSADAAGTGSGEAVAAVMLKTYDKAVADGDTIHAVIRASVTNQDAATSSSLTAPSKAAQKELLLEAWRRADIDPRTITSIETHGTGTKLGDPIEVDAINEAFAEHCAERGFCGISSLKTQIGHTDTAAGIANLVRAVLSLKYRERYANLHFNAPNPFIDFEKGAVFVNDHYQAWDAPFPRRVGVSSFGLSGTNCHLVLEEAPLAQSTATKDKALFMVSGPSEATAKQRLADLAQFLEADDLPSLAAISDTLNGGRSHFEWRCSFVAQDHAGLRQAVIEAETTLVGPEQAIGERVFVFSPDCRPAPAMIAHLCQNYPQFAEAYETCAPNCDATRSFAFQYAFYQMMVHLGLGTSRVIGWGIGKLVISVILEKRRLSDGLDAARRDQAEPVPSDLEARLARFMDGQDEAMVFVEMGPTATYSRHLALLCETRKHQKLALDFDHDDLPMERLLAELYLLGQTIDWRLLNQDRRLQRVPLPTYPFEKTRCWIRDAARAALAPAQDMLYDLRWVEQAPAENGWVHRGKTWLVFADGQGLGHELRDLVKAEGASCILVEQGPVFEKLGPLDYRLNPAASDQVAALKQHLDSHALLPVGIVHLLNYAPSASVTAANIDLAIEQNLLSQLPIFKHFDNEFNDKDMVYLVVAANAHRVVPADSDASPTRAMACGPLRAAMQDYPELRARLLDLPYQPQDQQALAKLISAELLTDSDEVLVAYREGRRYIQEVEAVQSSGAGEGAIQIQPGGTYLITGGSQGLGFEVARHLAEKGVRQLIILGRRQFEADHFAAITAIGSGVDYMAVDVADGEAMALACQAICERHHRIDGVIHAAGLPGTKRLRSHDATSFQATLAAKVKGSLILREALPTVSTWISFSSVSALECSARDGDYSAANIFLEQLALNADNQPPSHLSIAWPRWRETGMAYRVRDLYSDAELAAGLSTAEGLAAFDSALASGRARVLVSKEDPALAEANPYYRVAEDRRKETDAPVLAAGVEAVKRPTSAASAATITLELDGSQWTPTEEGLARIWAAVLEVERLDRYADFFDLGGHSLNGASVIDQIEDQFGVALEFDVIFDVPTLHELAALVDSRLQALKPKRQSRIPLVPEAADYPLSFSQRRLWILERMHPMGSAYHINASLRLKGRLDRDCLQKAFVALIERHEALRTRFRLVADVPRQFIATDSHDFQLAFADLSHEAKPEVAARDLLDARNRDTFDLETDRLLRAHVIQLDPSGQDHVLSLCMHHIIGDAWSLKIMARDLSQAYNQILVGQVAFDLPLQLQYKDYAAWDSAYLEQADEDRQYWHQKLAAPLPTLELPIDYRRPTAMSYAGKAQYFEFSAEQTQGLQALARRHKASLFMVLNAMVKALIYRYTCEQDIIVGAPIAGRSLKEVEPLIGFFVNILALRDRVQGDMPFNELLAQVRSSTTEAFGRQRYPFEKLVDELGLNREDGSNPLFEVVLSLENTGTATLDLGDVQSGDFDQETRVARFDLLFYFMEPSPKLGLFVEYRTALFCDGRIQHMAAHLGSMIDAILSAPETTLDNLPLLPSSEIQHLRQLSENRLQMDPGQTISRRFEDIVLAHPETDALYSDGESLTYRQVNELANALAYKLKADYGIGHRDVVGICGSRSKDMVVAILATLKLGAFYGFLDSRFPKPRLSGMIAEADMALILAEPDYLQYLPLDVACPVMTLYPLLERSAVNPPQVAVGRDPGYLIFTSGSTGKPKGVCPPQNGVLRLVTETDYFHPQVGQRMLQFASFGFDASVFEIFGGLLNGLTLHLGPQDLLYDPLQLGRYIREHQIDHALILTALFNRLVEIDPEAIRCLEKVFVGGEAASLRYMERALDYRKNADSIVNVYGPSEATVMVTQYIVTNIDPNLPSLPIGVPLRNNDVYILDAAGRLAPTGVQGEICLGGPGIAEGYLKREDLTREKFIVHPFQPEEKIYATGDLGRWNFQGQIEFMGRKDHQVQIRGFRVELGEIEVHLERYPGMMQVAVVATKQSNGSYDLEAFVVAQAALKVSELRSFLLESLPEYMLPGVFYQMAEIPVNANGKADTKALLARTDLDQFQLKTETTHVQPRTEEEAILASIWQELLGKDQISVLDKCFEVGIDSIKAIQVVARLHKHNLDVTVAEIFRYQTIEAIAARLQPLQAKVGVEGPVVGPVPLLPVQQWFFEQRVARPHHFNQSILLESVQALDLDALQKALAAMVEQHDMLRARYRVEGSIEQQVVAAEDGTYFEFVQLKPDADRAREVETHGMRLQASFDLETGPLMRAVVFRQDGQPDLLGLIIHHLVVDGVSWRILLANLKTSYSQVRSGASPTLPERGTSYKAWVTTIEDYSGSDALLRELPYWTGLPQLEALPLIMHNHGVEFTWEFFELSLSQQDTQDLLTDVNGSYHTEINDTLLTALCRAGRQVFGRDRLDLVMEGHGREDLGLNVDLGETVGWFTTIYPVALSLPSGEDCGLHIKHIKEQLRQIPNKGIGYGILRYKTDKLGMPSDLPPVSFNYLGQVDADVQSEHFRASKLSLGAEVASENQIGPPLAINGIVASGQLHLSMRLNRALVDQGLAQSWLQAWKDQLEGLIAFCLGREHQELTPDDIDYDGFDIDQLDNFLDNLEGSF